MDSSPVPGALFSRVFSPVGVLGNAVSLGSSLLSRDDWSHRIQLSSRELAPYALRFFVEQTLKVFSKRETRFTRAVQRGDVVRVCQLLAAGADPVAGPGLDLSPAKTAFHGGIASEAVALLLLEDARVQAALAGQLSESAALSTPRVVSRMLELRSGDSALPPRLLRGAIRGRSSSTLQQVLPLLRGPHDVAASGVLPEGCDSLLEALLCPVVSLSRSVGVWQEGVLALLDADPALPAAPCWQPTPVALVAACHASDGSFTGRALPHIVQRLLDLGAEPFVPARSPWDSAGPWGGAGRYSASELILTPLEAACRCAERVFLSRRGEAWLSDAIGDERAAIAASHEETVALLVSRPDCLRADALAEMDSYYRLFFGASGVTGVMPAYLSACAAGLAGAEALLRPHLPPEALAPCRSKFPLFTLLSAAVEGGLWDLALQRAEAGDDPRAPTWRSCSPSVAVLACKAAQLPVVAALLARWPDVFDGTASNEAPLVYACHGGANFDDCYRVAFALLEAGVAKRVSLKTLQTALWQLRFPSDDDESPAAAATRALGAALMSAKRDPGPRPDDSEDDEEWW